MFEVVTRFLEKHSHLTSVCICSAVKTAIANIAAGGELKIIRDVNSSGNVHQLRVFHENYVTFCSFVISTE